jgi:hypothetical protein
MAGERFRGEEGHPHRVSGLYRIVAVGIGNVIGEET